MTRFLTAALSASSLALLAGCAQSLAQEVPVLPVAPAQEAQPAIEPVPVPDTYRQQILKDADKFLTDRVNELYAFNPAGIVSREDVERSRLAEQARDRAGKLTTYLAFDLDGDGVITREEFLNQPVSANARNRARIDLAFTQSDTNGNGQLDFTELAAIADAELAIARRRRPAFDNSPMMFDLNADGLVDVSELSQAVDALAEPPEGSAEAQVAKPPLDSRGRPLCSLPRASAAAEMIILSGYQGSALSTVAVSGLDEATSVATLKIEAGETPLYIFATAYDSIVWKLSGATDRVERFVVQPRQANTGPGAGVVGLPASKVSFTGASACGKYLTKPDDRSVVKLKAAVSAQTGKTIDRLIVHYELRGVSIPSGTKTESRPPRRGPAVDVGTGRYYLQPDGAPEFVSNTDTSRTERELIRFNPDGVIDLKPEDVVSSGPVQAYDVLPQEAGLLQLLRSGALQPGPKGEYIITRTFPRFPAGLAGAHGVRFILKQGVKMPAGSPGHSSIVDETTGECLTGARCRR